MHSGVWLELRSVVWQLSPMILHCKNDFDWVFRSLKMTRLAGRKAPDPAAEAELGTRVSRSWGVEQGEWSLLGEEEEEFRS